MVDQLNRQNKPFLLFKFEISFVFMCIPHWFIHVELMKNMSWTPIGEFEEDQTNSQYRMRPNIIRLITFDCIFLFVVFIICGFKNLNILFFLVNFYPGATFD